MTKCKIISIVTSAKTETQKKATISNGELKQIKNTASHNTLRILPK